MIDLMAKEEFLENNNIFLDLKYKNEFLEKKTTVLDLKSKEEFLVYERKPQSLIQCLKKKDSKKS